METVSVKLNRELLEEIDSKLGKYRYGTRTEFFRDAIRDKLKDLEKEEALKRVEKYYGASNIKTTDKRLHKIREKIARSLLKGID